MQTGISQVSLSVLAFCLGALLSSCRLDVARTRVGNRLKVDEYEKLRLGKATIQDGLDALGVPDRSEWQGGNDYLWWHFFDDTTISMRFQLPISFFGYRHNFLQYVADNERTNTIELVFDENGVLEHKSIKIPKGHQPSRDVGSGWRFHINPHIGYSLFVAGDADFRDYDDLFRNGYLAGVEMGVQPVPPLVLGMSGHYQRYEGKSFTASGSRFELDDLELFTLEGKVRLQVPMRILLVLHDVDEMWRILSADDPTAYDGWLLFVAAGLGATLNGNVPVTIDGARGGNFFDDSWQFATSGEAGVEYSLEHLSVRLGLGFRSVDAFDEGNSGLPDNATAFQVWSVGLAVALKF